MGNNRVGVGFFWVFVAAVALTGCVRTKTYVVEKERVDQNLVSGNQGFLMGQSAADQAPVARKLTRKTYVTEVELGSAGLKKTVVKKAPVRMVSESADEPESEPIDQELASEDVPAQMTLRATTYIVEPNDTLQKISLKVYGTTKKWQKIFDANSDKLKSPDRIYAGQVLRVPEE